MSKFLPVEKKALFGPSLLLCSCSFLAQFLRVFRFVSFCFAFCFGRCITRMGARTSGSGLHAMLKSLDSPFFCFVRSGLVL
jgi:hypothetical protein